MEQKVQLKSMRFIYYSGLDVNLREYKNWKSQMSCALRCFWFDSNEKIRKSFEWIHHHFLRQERVINYYHIPYMEYTPFTKHVIISFVSKTPQRTFFNWKIPQKVRSAACMNRFIHYKWREYAWALHTVQRTNWKLFTKLSLREDRQLNAVAISFVY